MTEEESQRYEKYRKRKLYRRKYDFREFDPPVEHRESVSTQNPAFATMHGYQCGDFTVMYEKPLCRSPYYLPDDIYTSERNADPCPFIPESENPKVCNQEEIYYAYPLVKDAHDFIYQRVDTHINLTKVLANLLMWGVCLPVLGINFEWDYVLLPACIIFTAIFYFLPELFPPLLYFAPFSKRKRLYIKAYRFYENWRIREQKRRKRLFKRNKKRLSPPDHPTPPL